MKPLTFYFYRKNFYKIEKYIIKPHLPSISLSSYYEILMRNVIIIIPRNFLRVWFLNRRSNRRVILKSERRATALINERNSVESVESMNRVNRLPASLILIKYESLYRGRKGLGKQGEGDDFLFRERNIWLEGRTYGGV